MSALTDKDADIQELRGEANAAARTAPDPDPETAREAVADAKDTDREGESSVNPVYRTQGEDHVHGENVHRDTDAIISEFDSPAENTVPKG